LILAPSVHPKPCVRGSHDDSDDPSRQRRTRGCATSRPEAEPPGAAHGSGLQWSTVRNIAAAWVTTLPCAIAISGCLYFILRHMVGS